MVASTSAVPGFDQLHAAIFAPACAIPACHEGERGIAGLSLRSGRGAAPAPDVAREPAHSTRNAVEDRASGASPGVW